MTQEFKFGDKCYHLTGGMEVIIVSEEPVITDDGSKMWQIFDETFGHHLCGDDKLELIPHPDTVRLDWLMEEDIIPEDIYHNTQTEDEDGLPVAYFSKRDCRAAIDAAMQHEAKQADEVLERAISSAERENTNE